MKLGFLNWNFFGNGKSLTPGTLILKNNAGNQWPFVAIRWERNEWLGGFFDEAHHILDGKIKL